MAVRRRRPAPVTPTGVDRLLSWRRWPDVPVEFLEHADPEIRALAELTQAVVQAFRRWAYAVDRDDRARLKLELEALDRDLIRARCEFSR